MRNFIVFLMLIGAIAVSVVLIDKYYYSVIVPDAGGRMNFKTKCYLNDGTLIEGDLIQINNIFISVNTEEGFKRIETEFVKRVEIIKNEKKKKNTAGSLNMKIKFDNKRKSKEDSKSMKKIMIISKGEEVDIKKYIVKGKVVVFDFYADWCGPCRHIGPKIEELVNQNNDVVLRKINIVNWNSPVARQYHIMAIPQILVYDKKGRPVGRPTSRFDDVKRYISIGLNR